jgi:hypothetical protein
MAPMLHRITAALRTLAPLALAALQTACTALPAPPPSYAPTDMAPRPGLAYCSELEGAASARSTEYAVGAVSVLLGGLGIAGGGAAHYITSMEIEDVGNAEPQRRIGKREGTIVFLSGIATAAVGSLTLLWFTQDAGALENAAARGAKLPDDRAAYERCVRAYDGDVGLD